MMKVLKWLAVLLLIAIASCQVTPGKDLVYKGPVELSVKKGETFPGTQITFLGGSSKGAEVLIAGQKAVKQKGDSLDWKGTVLPNVDLELALRVLWFNEDSLHCGGFVTIKVKEPSPVAMGVPSEVPIKYSAPVTYWVKKGDFIPGTTVKYVGKEEEGAKLEGVEGYPYRKTADSIVWEGKLRDGIYLQLNVRVLHFDGSSLQVGGMAKLLIQP